MSTFEEEVGVGLSVGTVIKGYHYELTITSVLRRSGPFVWYETVHPVTGERYLAQVLPANFPSIALFRTDWERRAKHLQELLQAPLAIDRKPDTDVYAMAVYQPFKTVDADAGAEVAETLFQDLAALHEQDEYLGGLPQGGVGYFPRPRFYDTSLVPLLRFASPEVRSQLAGQGIHIAPTVRKSRRATAEGDIYALACWLVQTFPESDFKRLFKPILDGGGTYPATANQVMQVLAGQGDLDLAPSRKASAGEDDLESLDSRDEDAYGDLADELDSPPMVEQAPSNGSAKIDAPTSEFGSSHAIAPSPIGEPISANGVVEAGQTHNRSRPPHPHGTLEAPADISLTHAKAKLISILLGLGALSFLAAVAIDSFVIAPWLASKSSRASAETKKARAKFEDRLRRSQERD